MDGKSSKLYTDDFLEDIEAYGHRKPTFVRWQGVRNLAYTMTRTGLNVHIYRILGGEC